MSDKTEETKAAPDAAAAPPISINVQYIKDLSFEAPATPGIFAKLQQNSPDVTINVDVNAHPVQEQFFEVQLHIRVTCKVGEETAFICELVYGGLFTINVPEEHLQAILLIECPRLLFPFARNIVADASRDGGFPPLMLAPVDFVAMFQNQVGAQGDKEKDADKDGEAKKGNNKDKS